MATIRFEDVNITAKVIELQGIEDPSAVLSALGLVDAKVLSNENEKNGENLQKEEDPPLPATKEEPDTNLEDAYHQGANDEQEVSKWVEQVEQVEQAELKLVAPLSAKAFVGISRLRNLIQVFADAGITDSDQIVATCVQLKDKVSILKRIPDLESRIPKALDMWKKDQK